MHRTSDSGLDMLMPFRTLIRDKCGVTFKDDGLHLLETAVSKRIASRHLSGHEEYLKMVSTDEEEIHRLIDLVTINETYFFREKHHFDVLCDIIMPEMLEGSNGKIRILSAGCSTGEEAYSILLALIEKFGMGIKSRIEIHGADIDTNVIKTAKEAVYGKNSFRNDEHILMKYFEKHRDHRYHLSAPLRESVYFHVCNLLSTPFPNFLLNMDVIFYRNVSIYFDREIQQAIFQNLANLLNPEGRLFLSSTETYYHNTGILSLKKCGDIFLYHKKSGGAAGNAEKPIPPPMLAPSRVVKPVPVPSPPAKPKEQIKRVVEKKNQGTGALFDEAFNDAAQKKYASALVRIDELLRQDAELLKAYALKAGVLINLKKIDEAADVCREILSRDEWNLEAHLLLGIVARIKDEHDEALKMFRSALYICSTCWLAHYYLAEIYHVQNDLAGSYREYGITLKLLETRGIQDHGLTYFPLAFHAEQLIHLCRHSMNKISGMHKSAGHP